MVRGINSDGTLRIRGLGGINYPSFEGENVTIHTRSGKTYSGMLVCAHHSVHSFEDAKTMERNENTMLVLIDERVENADDVRTLGVRHGDYVSFDTKFTVTENGYVKSRFIDNRVAMACSFAALKLFCDKKIKPKYNTIFAFPFYEEVGFGGICVPDGISEFVALDIAVLGPDSDGSEYKVSICAKDASMPYDYDLTNRLIATAERAGCDFAVDLFYRYGSDATQAIKGGNNVKHAAFGAGVYSSHGVERTHVTGIENMAKLLFAYLIGE
jgi:putative aminopeptidase FrvX